MRPLVQDVDATAVERHLRCACAVREPKCVRGARQIGNASVQVRLLCLCASRGNQRLDEIQGLEAAMLPVPCRTPPCARCISPTNSIDSIRDMASALSRRRASGALRATQRAGAARPRRASKGATDCPAPLLNRPSPSLRRRQPTGPARPGPRGRRMGRRTGRVRREESRRRR